MSVLFCLFVCFYGQRGLEGVKKKKNQFILFLFSRPVAKEDKYAHFQLKAESISVQFKIFNYVSVEIGCIRISPLDIEMILS